LIDRQIEEINKPAAAQMTTFQDQVGRLIAAPDIGAEAARGAWRN